jgi:hypothetical protein
MVESASRARESVRVRRDDGRRLAANTEDIPRPARPRRRLLVSTTVTPPRPPMLGDLQDALARCAFRELPRHLAVHTVESAIGSWDLLGRVADRTFDRDDDISLLVGSRGGVGSAVSGPGVATSRELCVILSPPRRVGERLPRSIDPQRLPFGFGDHVVRGATMFVRMQQPNLDTPRAPDCRDVRGRRNPENVVMAQQRSG